MCMCNGIYMQVVVRGHLLAMDGRGGRGARVTTEIHLSRRITKTVEIYLACRVGKKRWLRWKRRCSGRRVGGGVDRDVGGRDGGRRTDVYAKGLPV